MSRYFFFDTETDGLPTVGSTPHLVTISWLICDAHGHCLEEAHALIKPNGFIIQEFVTQIHGITHEHAEQHGLDRAHVLKKLITTLNTQPISLVVGHNVSFDIMVLKGELQRESLPYNLDAIPRICTMHASTKHCQLPGTGNRQFKPPKLSELHQHLFGTTFANAHTSHADIHATRKCFFKLLELGLIQLPRSPVNV